MGTIKIYLKLVDGNLEYRDTESHRGRTITTEVNPGDKIVWKLDQCSGIKELNDIHVSGSSGMFEHPPKKKDFDRWKARIGKGATGEVTYYFDITKCDGKSDKIVMSVSDTEQLKSDDGAKIKIKD